MLAPSHTAATGSLPDKVIEVVRRYWGFDRLRPLQHEAIRAGLEQRDSLVVLPTGGGKSLCYQVPAVMAGQLDVVVSPLIALMKDQVDGLRECGYPAAALHGNMRPEELAEIETRLRRGDFRLLFVAPERLVKPRFLSLLQSVGVRAFAIDEAHCISQWGHDFRPEYRQLAMLRERFPQVSVHAYTATATPRVRDDIIAQLRLRDPSVLVGTFDRPNLVYRVVPRHDTFGQTLEIIQRHANQAIIIYCLSRRDTEELSMFLRSSGHKAGHYHAGMGAEERRATQDQFAEDKLEIVCATIAFGMGIDRGDVRCIIHTSLPKSVEHYQQETGRAGRDGLEAECVLLYSPGDEIKWLRIMELSAAETPPDPAAVATSRRLLSEMKRLASSHSCRHRQLSEYFGQAYAPEHCGACDVCLDEFDVVPDSTVIAQKILSCVARVKERFAAGHVVEVLMGANTERIRQWQHQSLSTYGLLKGTTKQVLANYVSQLVDQDLLVRLSEEEFLQLRLNAASWEVMRGARQVRFVQPRAAVKTARIEEETWAGVDRGLFEHLREWRRGVAGQRRVPAYVILGDATLRLLAKERPDTVDGIRAIKGMGSQKTVEFGKALAAAIAAYSHQHGLSVNQQRVPVAAAPERAKTGAIHAAFVLFERGMPLDDAARQLSRARSTTGGYLADFIRKHKPASIRQWVDDATYQKVAEAVDRLGVAGQEGGMRLAPVFEALGGRVPYEEIRLVATHLMVRV